MLNGIQLAAYLPLINIDIPDNAAKFSGFIAEVVTFDIPDVEMETVLSHDKFQCPEDDQNFSDINTESYSDQTVISSYKWAELRNMLWNDPYFNRT